MKILCHNGVFAECCGVCVYTSTLRRALVCRHSFSLTSFHQPPFSLLPPVSFFYQLSQLYHPLCFCAALLPGSFYLTVFSPNLLFVLRCLRHSVVMFFFLRSHFRTSEGDQEEIGLRKPAVEGCSAPFALQMSAQRSKNMQSKCVSA